MSAAAATKAGVETIDSSISLRMVWIRPLVSRKEWSPELKAMPSDASTASDS